MVTWSGTTFVYDSLNRMVRRQVPGEPEYHFFYTADDERILSLVQPAIGTPEFHWALRDFGGKVLREYVNGPAALVPAHDYIFRGDQPLGEVDFTTPTPTTYHLTLDHLGTPRLKTTSTGAIAAKWKYFPFGEEAIPAAQIGTALRFTGHERDRFNLGGVGDDLDYMHARPRSPVSGRFLSVDGSTGSRSAPQSWNRYSYAVGSPMTFLDPDGKAAVAFTGLGNDPMGGIAHAFDELLPQYRSLGGVGLFRHQDLDEAMRFLLNRQQRYPDKPVSIFGHSLGGHAALELARLLGQNPKNPAVDLLIVVDAAPNYGDQKVPANVRTAVNFFQSGPDLGGTMLTAQNPSATQVWNVQLDAGHTTIDDIVAASIVSMVESMAASGDPKLKVGLQFIQGVVVRITH